MPVTRKRELPQCPIRYPNISGEVAEQFPRGPAHQDPGFVRQRAGAADTRTSITTRSSARRSTSAYIDARDAAQAIRLSLESKLKGAHVFGIANANSVTGRSNDELLDQVFPGTKRKRPLKPNESLISIEKAKTVLGYRPRYNWKPAAVAAEEPASATAKSASAPSKKAKTAKKK